MQNINRGISTGALFLLVGWIYERRHTREISKLKGIQAVARCSPPRFAVMLSSIGLPGLNGFVGNRVPRRQLRRLVGGSSSPRPG